MPDDYHRLVVHGLDAKDITKFFNENTALDRDRSVVGSLSFARSVPIPPNQPKAEINEWLNENWGEDVHEDASNTTHILSLDGKSPKVEYKFYTTKYTQIHRWVAEVSLRYPKLFFELDPQWNGEFGDTWHEHGGESYTSGSELIYLWKDGIEYEDDYSGIYLLGILNPNLKLECTDWGVSFRQDLQKVTLIPEEGHSGWLAPHFFKANGRIDHMEGRHRTMFVIACYFTVLIDQTFGNHIGHYERYQQIIGTPGLNVTGPEMDPDELLKTAHLHDDRFADSAFRYAIPVVENQLKDLVRQHFPELKPDEVWKKISGYIPTEYPFFR